MKTWIETHLSFEAETNAIITPNETRNGIILRLEEWDKSHHQSAHLSFVEAKDLANQLLQFVKNMEENR